MKKITRRLRSQAGFSLIELMIAIGSIAALLAVISLGAGSMNSSRLSAMEQDIRSLYSAATAWAAQQATATFDGISLAALKAAGVIPANATGNNPWGAPYTLSGTVNSFTVTSDANSATNCTTLVARFTPATSSAACTGNTLTVTF